VSATLQARIGLLSPVHSPDAEPQVDRAAPDAPERVAGEVRRLALSWPVPAHAGALETWRALSALGRTDLAVARLVEGHVDALRILAEAGRAPVPGAVYGVWASASGGTGLSAEAGQDGGWRVEGSMRFCSGAWFIDRALVVISAPDGLRLVEIDVRAAQQPGGALIRDDASWPAVGMDATRSVDIAVHALAVSAADAVGGPGFYLDRPGFAAGGVGVAAVWLGGAAKVLDRLLQTLSGKPGSAHQRAHLGAIAVSIAAADALLGELAQRMDSPQLPGGWDDAVAARTGVELAVETVLSRAPRVSGATGLCRDAGFAHQMADLAVYIRQHHAESDYEQLGGRLLETGVLLGRAFG
jgi:hypothetical protein